MKLHYGNTGGNLLGDAEGLKDDERQNLVKHAKGINSKEDVKMRRNLF